MKYEVPIIYRGLCNFVVEANSPEEAKELAQAKFNDGDEPDLFGNEWEEIERVCDVQEMEADEQEPT